LPLAVGQMEYHMVWNWRVKQLARRDNHRLPDVVRQLLPTRYGRYLVGNYNSYIS
jgi:hypothetical protein